MAGDPGDPPSGVSPQSVRGLDADSVRLSLASTEGASATEASGLGESVSSHDLLEIPSAPLTRGELRAWYAYDWASRGPIVAISVYFPLLLVREENSRP